MSFVIEFVKQALSASMEDPVERRAALQKHITEVKAKCDSLKEGWAAPSKPYGGWTADSNNFVYNGTTKVAYNKGLGRKELY